MVSSELNKLSNAVRAASVTSVVGGTFSRTPGGTTIIVDQQVRGSGGGGTMLCPFAVSDASEGTTLKIQIAWGLVWNMLPTGMFPDNDPPLKMNVGQTCYVYCKIVFNADLLVTEVLFSLETDLKTNTSTVQYNLIAVVTVNDKDPQNKFFSSIKNICLQPFPSPCSLS